jgi:hypothetical protein
MNIVPALVSSMEPIKPWQRLACLLYSNGIPLHNVAQEVNMELTVVTKFVTSDQGAELMKALVGENPERMVNIIEATALDSLLMLVNIRDCGKTEAIRLSACSQLLDRFFPKAKAGEVKKKAGEGVDFSNIQHEIARLRAEVFNPEA